MWIGTIDGLNRYDGERIKIYNCNIYDDNSLSSTYINAIEEDSEGIYSFESPSLIDSFSKLSTFDVSADIETGIKIFIIIYTSNIYLDNLDFIVYPFIYIILVKF